EGIGIGGLLVGPLGLGARGSVIGTTYWRIFLRPGNPVSRQQDRSRQRRTGPRQPGRQRSLEYASIAARRDRRQGLRQSNSASADQGRRGSADHPEPPQRDQTGLLSEAFLSAAAQNRKLLLSYQGLAAHRHPLRQTRSKFPCRRGPHP